MISSIEPFDTVAGTVDTDIIVTCLAPLSAGIEFVGSSDVSYPQILSISLPRSESHSCLSQGNAGSSLLRCCDKILMWREYDCLSELHLQNVP